MGRCPPTFPIQRYLASTDRGTQQKAQTLSPGFFRVLQFSLDLARETGGIFDPTLGTLVDLWGLGPKARRGIPKEEEVARARGAVGHGKVILNALGKTARKTHLGLGLDLSATAKGWAVDRVGRLLEEQGIGRYMVEIGGESEGRGRPTGEALEDCHHDPTEGQGPRWPRGRVLSLRQGALATSGDYYNTFREDGIDYTHIIRPETGRPIRGSLTSVTVLDPEGHCPQGRRPGHGPPGDGNGQGDGLCQRAPLGRLFYLQGREGRPQVLGHGGLPGP